MRAKGVAEIHEDAAERQVLTTACPAAAAALAAAALSGSPKVSNRSRFTLEASCNAAVVAAVCGEGGVPVLHECMYKIPGAVLQACNDVNVMWYPSRAQVKFWITDNSKEDAGSRLNSLYCGVMFYFACIVSALCILGTAGTSTSGCSR